MKNIAIYDKETGIIKSVSTGQRNIESAIEKLEDGNSFVETDISSPAGYIVESGTVVEDNTPKPDSNKKLRWRAFQREADPLFFKWQRGEATREEYMAKVKEIKTRHPDIQ